MNKNIYLIDFTYNLSTESSFLFAKVRGFFVKNGYNIVDNAKDSDFILINTYGYLSDVEMYTYDYINDFSDDFKSKNIIIFGDLGSGKNILKQIDFINHFIPTPQLNILDTIFKHEYSINSILSLDMDQSIIFDGDNGSEYDNKLYFIEISSGCIHSCSFCHIKKNIGYVKSKKIDLIVKEFEYAVSNGYKNIILLSEDSGSYGKDINSNFGILLDHIFSIEGNFMLNIHYIHPKVAIEYTDNIIKYIDRIDKILIPIQSFDDNILELMNRGYKSKEVINFIKKIKSSKPSITIDNHIIYGYPTETQEVFINNIKLSNKYYNRTVYLRYSYIEGTKKFPDNLTVCKENLNKRLYLLLKLKKFWRMKNDIGENPYDILCGKDTYELIFKNV